MQQQDRPVGGVVREARRAKGMTQSELARQVGCRQSAISMFEAGRPDALSNKNILAVAGTLGLDAKLFAGMDAGTSAAAASVLKYCPSEGCPSNIPYAVNGELCFMPVMVEAAAGVATRCAFCGEFLEDKCPNSECAAGLGEGAFCTVCGTRYVTSTRRIKGSADEWADSARARIRELRSMTGSRQRVSY